MPWVCLGCFQGVLNSWRVRSHIRVLHPLQNEVEEEPWEHCRKAKPCISNLHFPRAHPAEVLDDIFS